MAVHGMRKETKKKKQSHDRGNVPKTVEEYIAEQPEEQRLKQKEMRCIEEAMRESADRLNGYAAEGSAIHLQHGRLLPKDPIMQISLRCAGQ